MNSHKMFEENSKGFKNLLICAKHTIFATGLSREQITRTLKTKILKNILSIFHDWDIDPPVSREKSLCGLATRACDWTNPQLSHQNRATLFLIILIILTIFVKTKYYPKTSKTLKNIFGFD